MNAPNAFGDTNDLKPIARAIFHEALAAVDVRSAVQRAIILDEHRITIAGAEVPRADLDRILILAMGKAAAPMHLAASEVLANSGVAIQSIVIAPEETYTQPRIHAQFLAGAHPLPDERSAIAARAALDMLHTCDGRTAVLFLISGGASAMVEMPLDDRISISDIANLTRALIGSGLPIEQMNSLRKHLSAVKGGRLAIAAQNARQQWNLLVSDVPSASPSVIASGPSLPDTSTREEARSVLQALQARSPLPESIHRFAQSGAFVETPKAHNAAFARSAYNVILSSDHLAQAATNAAIAHGYRPLINNTCDEWDYARAGEHLLQHAQQLRDHGERYCLISVGEVAVNLPRHPGTGGRNQHLAFWLASEIALRNMPITALSAGSDGIDGNSNAAGAVVDRDTLREASSQVEDPHSFFDRFDTGTLFAKTGHAIITGPTGNNLRDLRIFLVDPAR